MTTYARFLLGLTAVLLLVGSGTMSGATTTQPSEDEGTFVDPPKETKGHQVEVSVQVQPQLLKTNDLFIGVIPVNASGSCWLQGDRLALAKSTRTVYLGTEAGGAKERYQVVLLKCPVGSVAGGAEVKVADFRSKGIEALASATIYRTE